MPGKPAARVGDQTAHGGTITGPGNPMVLIEKKPAAVMGDMHVCPQVNPGPPAIPHVGAAIIATGVTVLIGGKPAARVGDMAICTGPPDSIVMGSTSVLIGDGGAGGGGGGGGGKKGDVKVKKFESEVPEKHYLDVKFEDKGGKPITGVKYSVKGEGAESQGALVGQVKKTGLKEGTYDVSLTAIANAKWSTEQAAVGDTVTLLAETAGIESGEPASLEIYIKDANFPDRLLMTLESKVDGDKIEAEWEFQVDEAYSKAQEEQRKKGGYSSPFFYFIASAAGVSGRSGLLAYKDYIELRFKDDKGNVLANKKYRVFLSNGLVKEGTLDGDGYAKVENIPPGQVRVFVDPRE